MYCSKLHAWWSTHSRLATLLSSLIACRWVGQTLWRIGLKDLSIDEMVGAWCFGCCQAHRGIPVGFLLLRYLVLFTVESLSLLYLLFISWFICSSRGTKVQKMLTLAPKRYTVGFRMVAKVILWCIWNHCIADSIDLHNDRAVNFLRKPSKIMSKYYFSKCYIFLSKKFKTEKYWVYIKIQHRCRPQKQWWSSKNTAIDF